MRLLSERSAAVERSRSRSPPAAGRSPSRPRSSGSSADWQAAVRIAAAEGGGFGPMRGFRRLRARLFGLDVAPPVTAYDAAVDVQARPDRRARSTAGGVDAKLVRKGLAVQVVEGQVGPEARPRRRRGRRRPGSRGLRPQRAGRAPARGDRAERQRRRSRRQRRRRRAPRSRRRCGSPTARRAGGCRAGGSHRCSRFRPGAAPTSSIAGAAGRGVPGAPLRDRVAQAAGCPVPGHGDRQDRDQAVGAGPAARHSRDREGDRRGRVLDRPPHGEPRRPGRRARAHDRRSRRRWASRASSPRTRRPTAARRGASTTCSSSRELIDGTLIKPGGTFSFNETTGERTAEKGFQEAPVIINGELQNGHRRRRLPGLDDRLQRGVRGRAPDRPPARITRSTSATTRSAVTRPSTTPTSTCASRTTPTTGCCCGRSSVRAR